MRKEANIISSRSRFYGFLATALIFLAGYGCTTRQASNIDIPKPPSGLNRQQLMDFYAQYMDPSGAQNLINGLVSQIPAFNFSCDFTNPDGSSMLQTDRGLATKSRTVKLNCSLEKDSKSALGITMGNPINVELDPNSKDNNPKYTINLPGEGTFTVDLNGTLCQTNFTLPSGDKITTADNSICRTDTITTPIVSDITPPAASFAVTNSNAQFAVDINVNDGQGVGATKVVLDNNTAEPLVLAVANGSTRFVFNPTPGINNIKGMACDALSNCISFDQTVDYQPVREVQTEFRQENHSLKAALFIPDPNQNLDITKTKVTAEQERWLTGMWWADPLACNVDSVSAQAGGQSINATCPIPKFGRKTEITIQFMDKGGHMVTKKYPTELPSVPKAQRAVVWGAILASMTFFLWRAEKHLELKEKGKRQKIFDGYIANNDHESAFDLVGRHEFDMKSHRKLQQLLAMKLVDQFLRKDIRYDYDEANKLLAYIRSYMTSFPETLFDKMAASLGSDMDIHSMIKVAQISRSIPAIKILSTIYKEDSTPYPLDHNEAKKREGLANNLIEVLSDEMIPLLNPLIKGELDIEKTAWLTTQASAHEMALADLMELFKTKAGMKWFYKRINEAKGQEPLKKKAELLDWQIHIVRFFRGCISGDLFEAKNYYEYAGIRSERLYDYYRILLGLKKFNHLRLLMKITPDSDIKEKIIKELASYSKSQIPLLTQNEGEVA